MGVKKDYVDAMTETIKKMHPEFKRDQIEEIVTRTLKERLRNPTIIMDNNVTGENQRISLTDLCNWIDNKNPVVSGNATFYMQPDVLRSPTSNMLKTLKAERKQVKKDMFGYKPSDPEYQMLDLTQQNIKVIMNAEYGGSGAPTAAFYTKYSPAATTLMAQSIITTMAAFFEGFVGDNHKFFHVNECIDWMNCVCQKAKEKKFKIPKWIIRPTAQETATRIKCHFYTSDISGFKTVNRYIENCSEEEIVYLYYANNMNTFVSNHPKVQNIISNILSKLPLYEAAEKEIPPEFAGKFEDVSKYNKWISKQMFLNPYEIPETIKDDMEEFITLVIQFIFVEYITPDSIEKLNNHYRNTVLLVDTDSNVINADLFVFHVLDNIFPGQTFGRQKIYNEMILVNVLCASISEGVARMLDFYGRCHHMNDEARAELTMKNEFMFRRFFIMKVKKRYAASIILREGNIMIPNKLEIKGMDFIKAGVTDEVSARFTTMLKNYILCSDDLELHRLTTELKNLEKEVYNDLKHGGTRFLKPQQFKAEGAYKVIKDDNGKVIGTKAWSIPVFRGVMVWNELYPDQKIYSLDRVKLVKLTVTNSNGLDIIKDQFPEEYKMVMDKIFGSSSFNIAKSGLKFISIPNNLVELPSWLIPLVDRELIVSDVISSFRSVLDALNMEDISFKTASGTASVVSCLVGI